MYDFFLSVVSVAALTAVALTAAAAAAIVLQQLLQLQQLIFFTLQPRDHYLASFYTYYKPYC